VPSGNVTKCYRKETECPAAYNRRLTCAEVGLARVSRLRSRDLTSCLPLVHPWTENSFGRFALSTLPHATKPDRESLPFPASPKSLCDFLSVDVEDYFQVEAFADCVSRDDWGTFSSRVRPNTERTLRLLAEYGCRGTFFVLGWVAERDPKLIREIADAGHEIACHSYSHRRVSTLSPEEFRDDLQRARAAIEDAAGVRVHGYRAPTFSIGLGNLWALDILSEEGFLYDSSIFPIHHDLYGFPGSPRFAYSVSCRTGKTLFEIPMTTVRMLGTTWPVGGGGYLRLLPMSYTRWAIEQVHRADRQPFVLYFHPWELDPEQPRIAAKWRSRFRHYTGLGVMESRLRSLLSAGHFAPMLDWVSHLRSSGTTPPLAEFPPSPASSVVS
jgi:polysaccharide deacetylase family protein (PEP-CTERM system associated)